MKNFIILIDGPKGSGKSTLAAALQSRLPHAKIVSLDELRRSMPEAKANNTYNTLAFELLLDSVKEKIRDGVDVIIDCGLTKENLARLEEVIQNLEAAFYRYSLRAPYEELLKRVQIRDREKERETNVERFDYLFNVLMSKDFHNYICLDTSQDTVEDLVEKILSDLG